MVTGRLRSKQTAASTLVASAVFAISLVAFFRVPFLASIGTDLGLTDADLAGIAVAYALGRLIADLPAALYTDRTHPYTLLGAGMAVAAAGGVLFARAASLGFIWGGAFLIGSASALVNSAGLWHFSTATGVQRRGTSVSIYSSTLLVGQAIGPAVATVLALDGTWRSSHAFAAVGLGVFAAVLFFRRRAASPTVVPPPDPNPGQVAGEPVKWQRTWPLIVLYIVPFYMFGIFVSTIHTLIPIVGGDLALSPASIGIALGIGGAARLLAILVGGRVSDRYSRTPALLVALLLTASGLVMLAVASSYLIWLGSVIALSAGSTAISISATMVADISPPERVGRNLGPWRFIGDVGMTVFPLGLGWTLAASLTTPALIAAAGFAVVLGALVVSLRRHHPQW